MKYFNLVFLSILSLSLFANVDSEVEKDSAYKIAPDDRVLSAIDSALAHWKYMSSSSSFDTTELSSQPLMIDSIQELYDSILEARLEKLNQETPLELKYNSQVKAFINLYVNKKRLLSSNVLGLAPSYFPMFEEVLDRFNMPYELKYLAVVESALNPTARSWVGAQGLWQFMYGTARMFDLKITSYTDERMDPYKATVAACKYMNHLYSLYGDWNLVLAAYNSGPGNVNKAIRRSGGKRDYWSIRPYLPRETRGYVPAFIAVNYMMNYAEEHQLYPILPAAMPIHRDTVQIKKSISLTQISQYLELDVEVLKKLNPQYKLGFVPESEEGNTLCLPLEYVGLYLTNEKSIYADIRRIEIEDSIAGRESANRIPEVLVHRVRSGEFLGYIANKYHCSVRDIMAWNNLRSSRINPGDQLKIFVKNPSNSTASSNSQTEKKQTVTVAANSEDKDIGSGKYQLHVVRSGDTLWDIAKQYNNISVSELKRLNSNLNFRRLKPGMQLKIKEIG